uniref:C2H2-type domain-containing protein n=1 Tax=Globodera pallida TaxID=36090 RepID=A0A183BYE4_GLOPA
MASFTMSGFESELENEGFARPKFIQALDNVVECRQDKQLVVEIKLDMAADVKWFMDGRLLKSCEEFFKDGRLYEGSGDGVHIIEVLPVNFKGLTAYPYRLMVPKVQNDCSLRVIATNEYGESESTAQIRVTPEVPTCRVKVGNDQNQQQNVTARSQLEKQPTFDGSYAVMDAGNAFEPTTTNAKIRRKSVVEVCRKTSTPIQRTASKVPTTTTSCQMEQSARDGLSTPHQQNTTPNNAANFFCDVCEKQYSSPRGVTLHKTLKHFLCRICDKQEGSSEELKQHKIKEHNNLPPPAGTPTTSANARLERPIKKKESGPQRFLQEVNKRLDTLEQFKEQQHTVNATQHTVNAKFQKSDNELNNKVVELERKFASTNLGWEQQTTSAPEEFLSDDEAK